MIFLYLLNKGVIMHLTTKDLTPFYRNSIGIDRMMNHFMSTNMSNTTTGYPPYNIIKQTEDIFLIEVAVAGFDKGDINVVEENGQLLVTGSKQEEDTREFQHQGIGYRKFTRTFQLADYVNVETAEVKNGILIISLKRTVPDSVQPKKIDIIYSD
jgi:molecular chaperone IbpA